MKKRNRLHFRSLLTLSMMAMVITISILIELVFLFAYKKEIKANAKRSSNELIRQVEKNINFYISDILTVAKYAKAVAKDTERLTAEYVENTLDVIISSRNDLAGISVFSEEGELLASTDSALAEHYRALLNSSTLLSNTEELFFFSEDESNKERALSYCTKIDFITPEADSSTHSTGILLINLNFNALSEILNNAMVDNRDYFFIVTNNGRVIYHTDQPSNLHPYFDTLKLGSSKLNGEDILTTIRPIEHTDLNIAGISFLSEQMKGLKVWNYIMVITCIASVLISIVASYFIGKVITNPIYTLEENIREVQSGKFDITVPKEGTIETYSLATSFSIMVQKIKNLMEDIKKKEAVKRQRELDALQAKINPHFLYNTLDSMIWMAETGDKAGIIKMASDLATLFRISIAKGHDIITLEEEFFHVKSYLEIQKLRYADKFTYSLLLPENLKHLPIVKLLIQPIVENSIYHGIKYLTEEGRITIEAKEAENDILIAIKDNGIGMSEETVRTLLSEERTERLGGGNGIGLKNINERIRLTYGEGYGLSVSSELDEGTTVTITIPKLSPIESVILHKRN